MSDEAKSLLTLFLVILGLTLSIAGSLWMTKVLGMAVLLGNVVWNYYDLNNIPKAKG